MQGLRIRARDALSPHVSALREQASIDAWPAEIPDGTRLERADLVPALDPGSEPKTRLACDGF
jgi:hypothetical protein